MRAAKLRHVGAAIEDVDYRTPRQLDREQVLSRRLKLLFRTGFLDRPLSQNAKSRLKPGTDPYVYALDREGARALNHKFGGSLAEQGWKYKNAKLSVTSIEHHLETSRFVGGLSSSNAARLRSSMAGMP
jgi:hypothetical protein